MKGLKLSSALVLVLSLALSSCGHDAVEDADYSMYDRSLGTEYDPNSGDDYNEIIENEFINTSDESVSTFSIDADGGSYSNVRSHLIEGYMPQANAVRIEEFLNYFDFDYPSPQGDDPLNIDLEMSSTPWNSESKLVRIGIKGKEVAKDEIPPANYVFLVDVSGSMGSSGKLSLVKYGLQRMVDALDEQDQIGLVTYASNPRIVLEPTSCKNKSTIKNAIEELTSGGSTNGEGGILNAYALAEEHFIDGGNNRVILCTDGDFNVGLSSQNELVDLIEEEREKGVFLTVIGVGHGNLQDGTMEQLANNGNGTYEYLDSEQQARRVFVEKLSRMLAVAKDVKVQVEFNPNMVKAYRLIGYENRVLANEDFEDDTKDAGELGMGQCVTAMYEVIMQPQSAKKEWNLKFGFRYKNPNEESSELMERTFEGSIPTFGDASGELQFAASLAAWGMLLRDSKYSGTATYSEVRKWASNGLDFDPDGARSEFMSLVSKSEDLDK